MGRNDKIVPAKARLPVKVYGFKGDIGQLEIGGTTAGICDRGGRTVDADELPVGKLAGEKRGQNADAAAKIKTFVAGGMRSAAREPTAR